MKNKKIRYLLYAILLGLLRAGSMYFYLDQKEFENYVVLTGLLFLIRMVVYTALFFVLLQLFFKYSNNHSLRLYKENVSASVQNGKRLWDGFWPYIIFATGWLIPFICKYPGAMCYDTWQMLHQYRTSALTAQHSPAYAVILGKLVGAFERIGYAKGGLWLFLFLQYLLFVFVFGYMIKLLGKLGIKRKVQIILTVIMLMNPYILGYLGVAIKDVPYALMMMLLILLTVEHDVMGKFDHPLKWMLTILSVCGIHLLRKNGIYVLIVFCIAFAGYVLKRKEQRRLFLTILLSTIFAVGLGNGINTVFHIKKANIREAYCLPFQQTARYLKYHSDDVTEEERAAIEAVLGNLEKTAKAYNPRIANPVKSRFTNDEEALGPYLRAWVNMFFRHPLCYLKATWNQNYYLFVPEIEGRDIILYIDDDRGYELGGLYVVSEHTKYYEPLFQPTDFEHHIQEWIVGICRNIHYIPVLNLFYNISLYVYLFVFLLIWNLENQKRLNPGVFFLPLMTLGFIVIGPVIYGHPRYAFPIIYAMPVLVVYSYLKCER